MHTKLDLPSDLLREAENEARRRGSTLDQIVSAALARELARKPVAAGQRVRFPVFPCGSAGPLRLTPSDIRAVEEEDDSRRGGLTE